MAKRKASKARTRPKAIPSTGRIDKAAERLEKFARGFIKTLNGTKAAREAGYKASSAHVAASRLLKKDKVRRRIRALNAESAKRQELSADRVLEEWRRLAFVDPRGFFDEDGDLLPLHLLTSEQAAAVAGFEVVIKNAFAGDGQTDTVHKIKFSDKTKALEALSKYFALFAEKVEHSGEIVIKWQE